MNAARMRRRSRVGLCANRGRRRAPLHASVLDATIEELRGKDVGGPEVGLAPQESAFFRAGRKVFPTSSLASMERLADADDPTLRAFGLWGLALANRPEPILRHACDRELVMVCPGGRVCYAQALGELAQHFANDPLYLGNPTGAAISSSPLVPKVVLSRRVAACAK